MAGEGAPLVCCLGELMWDFHASAGETLEAAEGFTRVPGGAASNVALGLRDRGVTAAVAGWVAEDAFGHGLKGSLNESGLDVSAVRIGRGRTGLVFIEGGERFLSYRPSFAGKARLGLPASWRRTAPEGAVLHVAALDPDWIQPERILETARRAQKRGVRLFVDVNARPRAWRKRRGIPRAFRQLLASADMVKASDEDAAMLGLTADEGGSADRLRADRLRADLGVPGTVVLTRGPKATQLAGPWGTLARRPPRTTPRRVVGAGDAFCVGLIASVAAQELEARRTWEHATRQAHASACIWLAHDGPTRGRAVP
jgi:sugar/nucleoside kinase (ribokinase family)